MLINNKIMNTYLLSKNISKYILIQKQYNTYKFNYSIWYTDDLGAKTR